MMQMLRWKTMNIKSVCLLHVPATLGRSETTLERESILAGNPSEGPAERTTANGAHLGSCAHLLPTFRMPFGCLSGMAWSKFFKLKAALPSPGVALHTSWPFSALAGPSTSCT